MISLRTLRNMAVPKYPAIRSLPGDRERQSMDREQERESDEEKEREREKERQSGGEREREMRVEERHAGCIMDAL